MVNLKVVIPAAQVVQYLVLTAAGADSIEIFCGNIDVGLNDLLEEAIKDLLKKYQIKKGS